MPEGQTRGPGERECLTSPDGKHFFQFMEERPIYAGPTGGIRLPRGQDRCAYCGCTIACGQMALYEVPVVQSKAPGIRR